MKVLERIARLLRADAHGVIDQIEERSLLLKQHLREAEIEIAHKRATLDAIDDERRRLTEQREPLKAEVARLDEDIELARSGDDPDLIRFAIRRWLPQRDALRRLIDYAEQLEQRRERLVETLERQQAELAMLRPRVRAVVVRTTRSCEEPMRDEMVSDEEVELEAIRRRRRDSEPDRSAVDPSEALR